MPLYVLEQLIPRLLNVGALRWDANYRVHICQVPTDSVSPEPTSTALGPVFDEIEIRLAEFAASHGISEPLASRSWADALIAFLKSDTASDVVRAVKIKDAIIGDTDKIDAFVIARFIDHTSNHDLAVFEQIVQIFTGVLIEDFIVNIQSLGDLTSYKDLSLYYDTTVLLRLLGTSGTFLQRATIEMHRVLQDLGCRTLYFAHTENEVITILSAVLTAVASGKEVFEETGDAMLSGEISPADLNDYIGTYSERLAALGVFKSSANYSTTRTADKEQIDEDAFATAIESEAVRQDRTYSQHNARRDSTAVAMILRLRGGTQAKDVASCRHIFISRNKLLQRITRKYLIDHENYHWTSVPVILTIGQITTVGWLAGAKDLEAARVTKDLLSNCYDAMRPDPNWARTFLDALENLKKENPALVEKYANSAIFLRTARSIAQDELLNQAAIFRRLNTAELFKRAGEITEQREREQHAAADRERMDAVAKAEALTTEKTLTQQRAKIRARADAMAGGLICGLQIMTVLLFLGAFFIDEAHILEGWYVKWAAVGLLGLLCLIHVADLTGIEFIATAFERLRKYIGERIFRALAAFAGV